VRHVRPLRRLLDGVARLLLRPDKHDGAAARCHARGELLRLRQQLLGLLQIDDVDPAALAEYEAAHLRVPAARLVAEVHAGLQQLLDSYPSHENSLVVWYWQPGGLSTTRPLSGRAGRVSAHRGSG